MKYKNLLTKILMITVIVLAFVGIKTGNQAKAASVSITEINYENSTMTIKAGANDEALYVSDDKQKKWDCLPAEKDENNNFVIDISWITTSKDYTLSLKCDISDTPVTVVIPKQVTKFKAKYSALDGGSIEFTNTDDRSIQWRKKDSSRWKSFPSDAAAFKDTIYALCANGAILVFRLAPENGNGANPGQRASKEVAVNVKKKSVAPEIKVDDEKMAINLKKGMEYRYCDENGNPINAEWTAITKNDYVALSVIAGKSIYDKATNAVPKDTYIQIRKAATTSAQVSNITTIKIPAQGTLPSDILDKAKLEYTSKTSFRISVTEAKESNPYEYCIINQDDIRDGIKIDDFKKVVWKPITSSSAITVNQVDDKVKDGSLVYLRKKAYKSTGDEEYRIASPWVLLGTVRYPGDISTNGGSLVWLTTTAGVCNADNTDGNLSFTMYSPTKSAIKEIRLCKFGTETQVGSALVRNEDFRCSVSENPDASAGEDKKYIITASIYSTAKVDKDIKTNEDIKLYAKIKLEGSNTEFVSSVDAGGIAFYIYPKSVINNPETVNAKKNTANELAKAGNASWSTYNGEKDFAPFTTSFERIYLSRRICPANVTPTAEYDPHQFRVRLDLGTRYIPDASKEGEFTATKVSVTKIKYDGVEMEAGGKYFDVAYADITDESKADWEKRMAVITFNVNEIEKNTAITIRDAVKPVTIYLSNGEVINDVKLNLKSTIVMTNTNYSFSFTEKSIKENVVTSKTENGVTTEIVEPRDNEYKVELKVFDEHYSVGCSGASWNGFDIFAGSSATNDGVLTVVFSNKKLNAIDVASNISSNVKFTFDNGYTVTAGCKITIVADNK